jgi:hypothetical protein
MRKRTNLTKGVPPPHPPPVIASSDKKERKKDRKRAHPAHKVQQRVEVGVHQGPPPGVAGRRQGLQQRQQLQEGGTKQECEQTQREGSVAWCSLART